MVPEEEKEQKVIQCYCCKQWGHKANDPACSLFSKKNASNSPQDHVPDKQFKPKDPWKYIEPKDLSKPVIIDDKKCFFVPNVDAELLETLNITSFCAPTQHTIWIGNRKETFHLSKTRILHHINHSDHALKNLLTMIWCSRV